MGYHNARNPQSWVMINRNKLIGRGKQKKKEKNEDNKNKEGKTMIRGMEFFKGGKAKKTDIMIKVNGKG